LYAGAGLQLSVIVAISAREIFLFPVASNAIRILEDMGVITGAKTSFVHPVFGCALTIFEKKLRIITSRQFEKKHKAVFG
jgi:hypothetical protein